MTEKEILAMEAGRELDLLVGETVMQENYLSGWRYPKFSTDISAAWQVVEKLREIDCVSIDLCYKSHGTAVAIALGEGEQTRLLACCDTAPEAICKAALIAKAKEDE